jgi:predicted N-acetyltransferase YhbS
MRQAVDAAREAGAPYILLVGDKPYYWPFGFETLPRARCRCRAGRSGAVPGVRASAGRGGDAGRDGAVAGVIIIRFQQAVRL